MVTSLVSVSGVSQAVGFVLGAGPATVPALGELGRDSNVMLMGFIAMRFPAGLFLTLLSQKALDDSEELDEEGDFGDQSNLEEGSSDHDDGSDNDGDGFSLSEEEKGDEHLQLLLDLLLLLATAFFNWRKRDLLDLHV